MTGRRPSRPERIGVLGRFWRDQRGVSAVEFALLAPVLIAFYFGSAEFAQGFMAQKRMSHATAQVADISSQNGVIKADELDDIFAIGALIMSPYSTAPLKMRVSSVTRGSDGVAKIDWSRGSAMTALSQGSVVALPAGVIANGESTIMSEATYDYVSPLRYLLRNTMQFRRTFYLRPRLVNKVICTDCPRT